MQKIALVTPLKDEIENIDKLVKSVNSQTIPIFSWIIIENDSTDGSKAKLDKINSLNNVIHFEVKNLELPNKEYGLGTKYANIVNCGFNNLKKKEYFPELDFVGILDSDIFAEEQYFEKLTKSFQENPSLGITSGRIVDENGKYDLSNKNWVRGGCRLWRKKCFEECGYIVGPSADTLSAAKAQIHNWEVIPTDAFVVSRLVGSRTNYGYYASSAYFRGHTVTFAILKSIFYLIKGYPKRSNQYFTTYFKEYFKKSKRLEDKELRNYFRYYLLRKLIKL